MAIPLTREYQKIYDSIVNPLTEEEKEAKENEELASIYASLHGGATSKQEEPLGYQTNIGEVYNNIDIRIYTF